MYSSWAMIKGLDFFLNVTGSHWRVLNWNVSHIQEAWNSEIAPYTFIVKSELLTSPVGDFPLSDSVPGAPNCFHFLQPSNFFFAFRPLPLLFSLPERLPGAGASCGSHSFLCFTHPKSDHSGLWF